MVDAAYSRKLQLGHAVVRARWQLIIPLVAAFVLIGGGWTVWAFSASKEAAPRASDELLETTKGLEVTQQQPVDPDDPATRAGRQPHAARISGRPDRTAQFHAAHGARRQRVHGRPDPTHSTPRHLHRSREPVLD